MKWLIEGLSNIVATIIASLLLILFVSVILIIIGFTWLGLHKILEVVTGG